MIETRKSSHIRTSTRRPGQKLTKEETIEKQTIFLRVFTFAANVRAACMEAGIDRSTVRQWEEHDVTFSLLYNNAKQDADDLIREEVWRRGVQGYDKPMVSMGKIVLQDGKPIMERVYSDQLLMFMARSRMSEFRDKQQLEHTGKDGGPIEEKFTVHVFMPDEDDNEEGNGG